MSKRKKLTHTKIPNLIIITAKVLYFFSSSLAEKFARRLFFSPIKYKTPKREQHMLAHAKQSLVKIPSINRNIVVYEYGQSDKKVLLIHGWSGRGTQLFKIADELIKNGYCTISFDAPSHGKSKGKRTMMLDFIESILELEKTHGPFEFAIGHSLGGMSLLNSINRGLEIKKGIIISSGNNVIEILEDFVERIGLPTRIAHKLKQRFESRYKMDMESLSADIAASEVEIPILAIHDNHDFEVPVHNAFQITKNLSQHELMITNELGHRKILGDKAVIQRIISFILSK